MVLVKVLYQIFFTKKTEERFNNCSIEGLDDNHEILVYNQSFIQEKLFLNLKNLKRNFLLFQKEK